MCRRFRIATLFLDNELRIKRFTSSMKQLFSLIDSDIGRSIRDITHTLDYYSLNEDVAGVLRDLNRVQKEIQSKDGKWYTLQILPYRTLENMIDGVVIIFFDITLQKINELASLEASKYAKCIFETIHESLLVLDAEFRVVTANQSFYKMFKVTPEDTEGKLLFKLGNMQWDIPKLHEMLNEIMANNSEFNNYSIVHDFPGIGKKKMLLNARPGFRKEQGMKQILLAIEDITDYKDKIE